MNFLDRLNNPKPIIIDGAMGTQLFKLAPDHRGPYEFLNIVNPEIIETIHNTYIDAGAEVIMTNTFGGSRLKLSEYGIDEQCREINRLGAEIAKKAAKGKNIFVAGSVGPTGRLVRPIGETEPEIVYESFKEQCLGLAEGGVDLIIIETMNDLQEAKLAVLAAKDATSLPVVASMTFEENGKTVSGTDIITGIASLSAFGADIAGANCSMGPEGLQTVFKNNIVALKEIGIPISAWANAGLPEVIEGRTHYSMSPDQFAQVSLQFGLMGIHLIGGCCGTTPDHIRALAKIIESESFTKREYDKKYQYITSRTKALNIKNTDNLIVVGERLNPTARKKFAADLKEGKQSFLREDSRQQESEGAHILDINVGVPTINEVDAMERSVETLSQVVAAPLMIDSDNKEVIEKALFSYPGAAILNSINGKQKSIDTMVPIMKRFGTFAVALCLDETGIHIEASKRIEIGERLIKKLQTEGIDKDRLFVDPLILTESAEPGSAVETLKVIKHFADKGIKTSIGLSNISFGLPQRKFVNITFLKMAIENGLTAAISNPSAVNLGTEPVIEEDLAKDFLTGKDPDAKKYIQHFKQFESKKKEVKPEAIKEENILHDLYELVVDGNIDEIEASTTRAVNLYPPETIMDDGLLKGLEKVGDLYSTGEYFLPQMIASANAMKKGFHVIKPLLSQKAAKKIGKVIICTVQGDIHDIGKNIVAMMMENHGFEVHDLGKDIPAEEIIKKTREIEPHLICLSSLLTTTMHQMSVISNALKDENLSAKLLIGGAVVNEEYADSIGAIYGEDAVDGITKAKSLVSG